MTEEQLKRGRALLGEIVSLQELRDEIKSDRAVEDMAMRSCARSADFAQLLKVPLEVFQRSALDKIDTRIQELEAQFSVL